jgi:GntR family transcriptional regulator/MocR family aminotransferase
MLRPWALNLIVRRDAETSVHQQIVHALIGEIRAGRLPAGSALPGSRKLADHLGVNRKTVVQAYDELTAQGWLTSDVTRATFVSADFPAMDQAPASGRGRTADFAAEPDFPLGKRASGLTYVAPPAGMLTFDDGAPDTRLAPVEHLARAYRRGLLEAVRGDRLGYGDPKGQIRLRRALATMLNLDRGLSCTTDNICLVRGSQMGIYLAARVLVRPGDTVVMEALSYPPAREAFLAAGAEIATVEVDSHGLKVDQLERLCRRKRVRAVYVTPHHHFPTTVSLRPERRLYLGILAEQFGFAVIEDDYDHEFQFDHRPMLPLASADRGRKVIYIGSMSKLLTPSLRVGYMHASTSVIERAAAEIMTIDRQGDPATEAAVAELMESGAIKRHTRHVLRRYAERRARLADLLRDRFGEAIDFTLSAGGLAIWAGFRPPLDMAAFAAAGRRMNVGITPGGAYSMTGEPVCAARLGFGSLNEDELAAAVDRLAGAYKALDAA